MNRSALLSLLLLGLFGGAFDLSSGFIDDWNRMKSITPQGYVCHRATGAMTIDGRIDEAAWRIAPWTKDFMDIEGGVKPKPRYRTRVKMLWDDDYFYVAAELEEPHVWATLTQHDAVIFQDNDFEVFIDPDGDSHEYYEFEINALNTGWDLLLKKPYKDGGPALNSWEIPGLKTAVRIRGTMNNPGDRDEGWSVEMAFPWKVLAEFAHRPALPHEGDQWRVNFSRVEWLIEVVEGKYRKVAGKKEDNWVWSPQGIIDMHRPEKWGSVQFSRQKAGRTRFVPDPAASTRKALQTIYYSQRDFQASHARWASSLEELGFDDRRGFGIAKTPTIRLTGDGFEITTDLKSPNGNTQSWHIRQDARIWPE